MVSEFNNDDDEDHDDDHGDDNDEDQDYGDDYIRPLSFLCLNNPWHNGMLRF